MPRKYLFLFSFLAFVLLLAPAASFAQDEPIPDHPEILWDTWGVPHIFAPTDEGLFYAFGWAQAQNHGDLILKLYGQARGRAAEYWGKDFLDSDKMVRMVDIPGQAEAGYTELPADFKSYLDAFVKGINDYVTGHPDQIDAPWKAVLPITPQDVIGNGIRVLRYTFVAGDAFSIADGWTHGEYGSNAWAIGPSRSASGNAMLLANPHQPWSDAGLWIEAQLVSPDVSVYGAALVGNPVLGIAFNQYLGWTHTVNTADGWDLYKLTLTKDGSGYVFDGKDTPFDVRQETIKVRQDDGSFSEVPLTVKNAIQGPVITDPKNGTALALRVVGDHVYEASEEWWEMDKAKNLQEFQAAISNIRIPMFTIMYADRDGNIMHVFNAQVPMHSQGDWAFWNNMTVLDSSHPAFIPGDSSQYVWTTYHPYKDLPKVLNPPSGWLENSNEPPWTTTLPLALNPKDYPAYMAPPPFIWPRPQTSMRMLNDDPSITFDELIQYKQSTFVELTRWVLDDLISAASKSDKIFAKEASDVLRNWDRHADADSVGAVLFALWAQDYLQPLGYKALKIQWDINDPLNTPSGLADPEGAVTALSQVATQLEAFRSLGGGIDAKWGDIFRLRYGKYDLPANGAPDLLGTFRVLTFEQDKDLRFKAVHGDSYIALVEFSNPVHAKVLLSYGNSSQPNSPHIGDQLQLFTKKELRDAWLTQSDIETHLEDKIVFDQF